MGYTGRFRYTSARIAHTIMATNPAMTSKGSKNRTSGKSTRSLPITDPGALRRLPAMTTASRPMLAFSRERYVAEKHNRIALGVSSHVNIAQERHHVPMDRAIDLDRTQEADHIVRLFAFMHDDIVTELHYVAALGARR